MCGEFQYRMQLAALWTETILYGIYMMLFAASVYVVIWKRQNMHYLVITILLFSLTTIYTLGNFIQVLLTPEITSSSLVNDDILLPCTLPSSPTRLHEAIIRDALMLLQDSASTALFIIADGLLIFRCFRLWDSKIWAISFPLFLLTASSAFNIAWLYYSGILLSMEKSGFTTSASQEVIAAQRDLVANIGDWLSLATNVVTTFLAVFKIWLMMRDIKAVLGPAATLRYYSAIAMIVESGAVYSASLVGISVVQALPIDCVIPSTINQQLLAIAPTLIIVRVGMGKGFDSVQDSLHASHTPQSLASHRSINKNSRTGTLSAIHFQSVHETESAVSGAKYDGQEIQAVSVEMGNEDAVGHSGAMV